MDEITMREDMTATDFLWKGKAALRAIHWSIAPGLSKIDFDWQTPWKEDEEDSWIMEKRTGDESWMIGVRSRPFDHVRRSKSTEIVWDMEEGIALVEKRECGEIIDAFEISTERLNMEITPFIKELDLMILELELDKISRGGWRSWNKENHEISGVESCSRKGKSNGRFTSTFN